jgi:hypothetical protein
LFFGGDGRVVGGAGPVVEAGLGGERDGQRHNECKAGGEEPHK